MKLKKILGRKMSPFEISSILTGITVGLFSIFKGNGNYVPTLFGIGLLVLVGFFIKGKQKNIVLVSLIFILNILLFINTTAFFTTTFSPVDLDIPPSTLHECQQIGGVGIPISGECSVYYVETKGTAGEGFICCLPDTCQGEWKRVWNSETKIYEKFCYE